MLIFYLLHFFFSPGGVAEAPRGTVRAGTSDRSRQGEVEGWVFVTSNNPAGRWVFVVREHSLKIQLRQTAGN